MDDHKIPHRRNFVLTCIFYTYRRTGGVGRLHEPAVDKKSPQHPYTCAVVGAATSIFVVLYFVYLLLANALAIIFLSPIMLTALSLPILVERVG